MPIYEYVCEKCKSLTEALQKFSDLPLTQCPHCTGKLNKLISLNSFHLKGTGWYVTDFADQKPKPEAKESVPTNEKTKANVNTATTKAEAKIETKAEAATTTK